MGDWQPIETAAKDEPVLIFSSDARWPGVMVGILSTFFDANGADVCTEWGDFWTERELDVEPTHWQPLPPPPSIMKGNHAPVGEEA